MKLKEDIIDDWINELKPTVDVRDSRRVYAGDVIRLKRRLKLYRGKRR